MIVIVFNGRSLNKKCRQMSSNKMERSLSSNLVGYTKIISIRISIVNVNCGSSLLIDEELYQS